MTISIKLLYTLYVPGIWVFLGILGIILFNPFDKFMKVVLYYYSHFKDKETDTQRG